MHILWNVFLTCDVKVPTEARITGPDIGIAYRTYSVTVQKRLINLVFIARCLSGGIRNIWIALISSINTLRPRQDGHYFADDVLKCIFLNENVWILFKIPLKFVPKGPINNIPALVQIMAWRRPGDKPLSESMLVFVPTHICVTRPQWVNNNILIVYLQITSPWLQRNSPPPKYPPLPLQA